MEKNKYAGYVNELNEIKKQDLFRYLKTIEEKDGCRVLYKNKKYLNLSSNDYLGLGGDRGLHEAFYKGLDENNIINSFGLGSASSRLLTGDYLLYRELEDEITELYRGISTGRGSNAPGREALVFNSGYHANVGMLSALAGRGDLIISDSLNHASIIDGVRLSRADSIIFTHRDYEDLTAILEENRKKYNRVIIVSESVFSMDGDIADIVKLVDIKKKFDALLYIDEAHALGVFGSSGLGICDRDEVNDDVDIIMATFGKALASLGAYGVMDRSVKEYLVNRMRTLIFTTSLPPVIVNWNLFIIKMLTGFSQKREKLLDLGDRMRRGLKKEGLETAGESHIVPVIIGENAETLAVADRLQGEGFLVFPIRPPTVREGTSRIRISLRADLDWEEVKKIPEIISQSL